MSELVSTGQRWIGVATLDWASPDLVDFYPAEVPQDWHLTWYANLCMAVVLPPSRWLSADALEVAQWVAQTHENFWFYLRCESVTQVAQASLLVSAFAGKCGGFVVLADLPNDVVAPVALLREGQSVLFCRADSLRDARGQVRAWLDVFSGEHGLIVLDGQIARQIKEVQTLLELMGVLS